MKPSTYVLHFAALLLSLAAASCARADWLSSLNYSVAVSNSPSGPFMPAEILWAPSVPPGYTPQVGIYLTTESLAVGFESNGKVYLPLGLLAVNFGTPETLPTEFPPVSFAFQISPPGKKSLVLSSQLTVLNNGNIQFADGGSFAVSVASRSFDVTFEAIQRPTPLPPDTLGQFGSIVVGYDIDAVVPLSELSNAPEPSSLSLMGIGVVALIGAMRRRRPVSELDGGR
jgi:hypothetical protein